MSVFGSASRDLVAERKIAAIEAMGLGPRLQNVETMGQQLGTEFASLDYNTRIQLLEAWEQSMSAFAVAMTEGQSHDQASFSAMGASLTSIAQSLASKADVIALATKVDVGALDLVKATIPAPAAAAPPEVTANAMQKGAKASEYALADHTHPSRVQRKNLVLNAQAESTWNFATAFTAEPNILFSYREAAGQPIAFRVKDFIRATAVGGSNLDSAGATGNFTGVIIGGSRAKPLPTIVQLTGIALLGQLLTGVNSLIMALSGYDVWGTTGLAGVRVYVSAAPET